MHFNPKAFPTPEVFEPNRWIFDVNDQDQVDRQKVQNLHLRSFGGGTGLCSGRFVAEQEIITLVSVILILFDIKIEDPESFKLNPQSIGVMSPVGVVKAKLRKRK